MTRKRPSDAARTTQATYDAVAGEFLANTRSPERSRRFAERFAARAPRGARVADLGSGPGRDAALLREYGLEAFCLDRSIGMLRAGLREFPAIRIQGDLLALPLAPRSVWGVWANASLLHLSESELPVALAEIRRIADPGGRLHLTVKQGDGSGWEDRRYGKRRFFQYWTADALDAVLERAGLAVEEAESLVTRRERWLVRLCALAPGA